MPTENPSSNAGAPFQREDRYIVIKVSDLANVPVAVAKPFAEQLTAIQRRFSKRECLVIESDWPEFEQTWAAIEARVTGKPSEQHQGEPVATKFLLVSHPDGNQWRVQSGGKDHQRATQATHLKIAPLYTNADPAEVERWKQQAEYNQDTALRWLAELEALRPEVERLRAALKFYADGEHYHFESGNWDTVSGEPLNILWCGDEPDFIEDGSVARSALERRP